MKKGVKDSSHKKIFGSHMEHALLENMVALQKVNVGLTEKFDKLANEISQLLSLFEVTARTFTKNMPIGEHEKDKEFLEKIDTLLEQNKVLAKGLGLMEERLRERMYGGKAENFEERKTGSTGRPLPKF